jgi:hypothetical protein
VAADTLHTVEEADPHRIHNHLSGVVLIAGTVTLVLENLSPIHDESNVKRDPAALGASAICAANVRVSRSRTPVRFLFLLAENKITVALVRIRQRGWIHTVLIIESITIFLV